MMTQPSSLLQAFQSRNAPKQVPGYSVDPKTVARREKILKMLGGPTAATYKAAYEAGKQYASGDRNAPVSLANTLSGLPTLKSKF